MNVRLTHYARITRKDAEEAALELVYRWHGHLKATRRWVSTRPGDRLVIRTLTEYANPKDDLGTLKGCPKLALPPLAEDSKDAEEILDWDSWRPVRSCIWTAMGRRLDPRHGEEGWTWDCSASTELAHCKRVLAIARTKVERIMRWGSEEQTELYRWAAAYREETEQCA